jgi:hypothetical protein
MKRNCKSSRIHLSFVLLANPKKRKNLMIGSRKEKKRKMFSIKICLRKIRMLNLRHK